MPRRQAQGAAGEMAQKRIGSFRESLRQNAIRIRDASLTCAQKLLIAEIALLTNRT